MKMRGSSVNKAGEARFANSLLVGDTGNLPGYLPEKRLRYLLDSTAEGIYTLDVDGRCTFCNAACVRLLGYQHENELLGKELHYLIHHTRIDGTSCPLSECRIHQGLRCGTRTHVDEEIFWRADGTSFETEYWTSPLSDSESVSGCVVTFVDISGRRRVERNSASIEERFRRVIRDSPFPVLVHAEDGKIMEVSEFLLNSTGYTRAQLDTMDDWIRLAFRDDQDSARDEVARLFSSDDKTQGSVREIKAMNGGVRVWEFISAPLPPLANQRRLVVTWATDVTERNRIADDLRSSEQQSREIIESLPQLVWTCLPDGSCDFMSRRWVEYTGVPLAEHVGSGWIRSLHPDDREWAMDAWMQAVSSNQPYDIEYRIRRFDGEYRWFRALARPLHTGDGRVARWFGACTDIQERKAHSELVASLNTALERRVEEQTRELQMALWEVREQVQRSRRLNDAALAIQSSRGLSSLIQTIANEARIVIGAHLAVTTFIADPNDANAITCFSHSGKHAELGDLQTFSDGLVRKGLTGEFRTPERMTQEELELDPAWQFEGRRSRSSATMRGWLAVPLITSQDRILGSIGVSDRQQGDFGESDEILLMQLSRLAVAEIENTLLYEESERTNRELETANQQLAIQAKSLQVANKELESFSYSVSHDLRAPLRSMDSFSRIILEEYGPQLDEEGHRLMNIVRDEAQRMGQLIDDLLQFSRMGRQSMELVRVDMAALARHAYNDLPAEGCRHVRSFEVGPLPFAHGDFAMLRQVWRNLLGNAVKFTSHSLEARIEVGSFDSGEFQVYFVRDNGTGFDPRFTHKLFGVFQRLHAADEFEGTGVGLAIVQRVIHRHDGQVWAEGRLNNGATFYFSMRKPEGSCNG